MCKRDHEPGECWKDKHDELLTAYQGLEARCQGLQGQMAEMKALVEGLQRQVFGRKSEKLPPVATELRQRGEVPPADPEETAKKRAARAAARKELPTRLIRHAVRQDQRVCPKCGGTDFRPLGDGRESVVYEYVPARVERHVHVQEKLACRCGEYIVTADAPARVVEGGAYGPGFMAHVVTSKCLDSIPLYRQEKQFQRLGIPVGRTSLMEQFHACADILKPVSDALLAEVAQSDLVQADETPIRMQNKHVGYLWCFRTDDLIGYRYSASRGGQTPAEVLGGHAGTLVVDAYTGYNRVFTPEGWSRAGCLAHLRRRFFEARSSAPEADQALDQIREVYRVEHDARAQGLTKTPEHTRLRQERSRPLMTRFHAWLTDQQGRHPPRGPMGKAIAYGLKHWEALARFLDDAAIPLDNNASERALRVAALGRKNFLFVGHERAGQNLAGLYSLVATCDAHGVNAPAYLADVLLRVQTQPHSAIQGLLPTNWRRLFAQIQPANAP
jgi:transposase